jgi:alpha-1,2-glucosyltransferase
MVRQNNIVWILYLIIYRVLSDHKKQILAPKNFLGHIFTIIKIFLGNKILILSTCKLQLIVMTLFGFYLKLFNNGRFIFGDHLNHQITFHPNQMLYLSLFILVNLPITFGEFLSGISNFFQRIYISRHSLSAYLFILSLSIIFVDKYTLIHQFILADNRHYTFYIYRYILKYNFFKYLLCFMYAFSFNVLFKLVVNSELKLIKFILWLGASFGYLCFG